MASRDENFMLRLSAGEKEAFKLASGMAGISLSAWVRERLRHAAIRELEAASRSIAFLDELGGGNDDSRED